MTSCEGAAEKVRRLSALDEVLPSYPFRERHERTIAASQDVVWSALLAITTQDLRLSSLLMGIRGLPSRISGRSNGLRRASHKPVIEQFIAGGFRKLRDDPPNVLVAGAATQPCRLAKGEVADVCDLAGFRAFKPAWLCPRGHIVRARTDGEREMPVDRDSCLADGCPGGTGLPSLLVGDSSWIGAHPSRDAACGGPPIWPSMNETRSNVPVKFLYNPQSHPAIGGRLLCACLDRARCDSGPRPGGIHADPAEGRREKPRD